MKKNHSFMRNMYSEKKVQDITKVNFTNARNVDERKVGDYQYKDPDVNCKELYEMEKKVFLDEAYPNAEITVHPQFEKQLIIYPDSNTELIFTSDYIGPSVTSAWYAGLEESYVWEAIIKGRTIGGHILWPCCPGGINPSKATSGSQGMGISDRTDIAFYELKNYLSGIDAVCYNTRLRKSFALPMNQEWFKDLRIFGCNPKGKFESFCDFFMLKGSFVDEDYNIIWFADTERKKENYESVKVYFENNIKAIEKRNEVICRLVGR